MKNLKIVLCVLAGFAGLWWWNYEPQEPLCCTKECKLEQIDAQEKALAPSRKAFEQAFMEKKGIDKEQPDQFLTMLDLRNELEECADTPLEDRAGATACDDFLDEELQYFRLKKHFEKLQLEHRKQCRAASAAEKNPQP